MEEANQSSDSLTVGTNYIQPTAPILTTHKSSLKLRLAFLICGLALSGGAIAGGTALLLRQRSLNQNVTNLDATTIENEIKNLDQAINRSRNEENRIFEEEGMNDDFFERANETANLETKKEAYEEILSSKESGQPLSTAEDSGQEILAYFNGSESSSLTPFINLLFIVSPFPALIGIIFFFNNK